VPPIGPDEFRRKVHRILSAVYGGLRNIPNNVRWDMDDTVQMAELLVGDSFASYNHDRLTTLVFAAHEECLRAELSSCNPQYMCLRFWPRLREGKVGVRHPTIEQAIESFRVSYPSRRLA
jgi:hypothetical protein